MAKKATLAQLRVRSLIERLTRNRHGEIKAPNVVATIIDKHWPAVYTDRDVARHLISVGLDHEVRPILNRYANGEAQEAANDQLELFPEAEREVAKRLEGLVRAYVPSRAAHVPLYDPDEISIDELTEAGRYRITQGHGCIRTGNAILQLAALRGAKDEQAA